jgi:pimeloyl-ACP methyl ester carboxylesterase
VQIDRLRWRWGRISLRGAAEVGERRCLVVFVPGIHASWPQVWEYNDLLTQLDDVLWRRFHERHWLPFRYLATFWSPASPDEIARKLIQQIEQATARTRYDAVVLIAHSFGGLILRRAILLARDAPWLAQMDRIILLASTSRGLVPATRLQRWLAAIGKRFDLARLGIGRLALAGLKPTAWLDELSHDWRAWLSDLDRAEGRPKVIQIQGTRDRVVALGDDADLRGVSGFQEVQILNAGHRYFLLKRRWQRSADPVIAEALQNIRQALDDAIMK